MQFIPQKIPEIILITPKIISDKRGYFLESFRQDLLKEFLNSEINFIQDNESKSPFGVLRGLHYQIPPYAQNKLVKVISGSVLDVVVDIRKNSETFGQHLGIELNSQDKNQLFIPKGFAHGFVVLSSEAIFSYKVDELYKPELERGIIYNDDTLEIDWQLNYSEFNLSEKDKKLPKFLELPSPF